MGNTCCAGRNTEKKLYQNNDDTERLENIKSKPGSSKKNKSKKSTAMNSSDVPLTKKPTWQDMFDVKTSKDKSSKLVVEEGSLAYSSDSDQVKEESEEDEENEESQENNESQESEENNIINPAVVFSNRSEMHEGLEYNLTAPTDLSKIQQNQIISALDKYHSLLKDEEEEQVDGLAPIIEKNKKFMVMLTTIAIYIVNADNLSIVEKRIRIEDFQILVISKLRDSFLIGVKIDYLENILIKSEFVEDLLKGIQQIYFEGFGNYLPWINKGSYSDLGKLIKNKNLIGEFDDTEMNSAFIKIATENGNIGEIKVLMENCSDSAEKKNKNVFFLMTDNAVYTLDDNYTLKNKFLLNKIEKVSINKKNQYLVIYEEGGVHMFTLPIKYSESIKQYASKIGNKIKVTEE